MSTPIAAGLETLAIEYRFYAGARHELLHEAEKDRVHREIGDWLTQILDS